MTDRRDVHQNNDPDAPGAAAVRDDQHTGSPALGDAVPVSEQAAPECRARWCAVASRLTAFVCADTERDDERQVWLNQPAFTISHRPASSGRYGDRRGTRLVVFA